MWQFANMHLMQKGSASLMQINQIESGHFQSPAGRTIPPAKTAPYVLVRVDDDLESIFTCLGQYSRHIVKVLLIILPWAGVFDRLPSNEKAQAIETPDTQAVKVFGSGGPWKRATDERNVAMIEEPIAQVGGAIGEARHFAAATQIDAAQKDGATVFIPQPGPTDFH